MMATRYFAALVAGCTFASAALAGPALSIDALRVSTIWGEGRTGTFACDLDGNFGTEFVSATHGYGGAVVMSTPMGFPGRMRRTPIWLGAAQVDAVSGTCRPPALPRILIALPTQLLIMDGWPPGVRVTLPIGTATSTLRAIVDVDGDGLDEIAVLASGTFTSYAETGLLERSFTVEHSYTRSRLGQFDSDPQLELVLLLSQGLELVDTTTGAVDWRSDKLFAWDLAIGNLDADPALEIALMRDDVVSVYDAGTIAPIAAFATGPGAIDAVDVDADGRSEIVVRRADGLQVFDPEDGGLVGSFQQTQSGIEGIAAGDFDGDGAIELAFGGRGYTERDSFLKFVGFDSGLVESSVPWEQDFGRGPVRVDVDADGSEEFVLASYARQDSEWPYGFGLAVLDAASRSVEYQNSDQSPNDRAPAPDFVVSNVDADPAAEIVLLHGSSIRLIDGRTREVEALLTIGSQDSWKFMVPVQADGDAPPEVLLGSEGTPRLGLYDLQSRSLLWRSVALSGNELRFLAVEQLDHDPSLEVIAGTNAGLWVWELDTLAIERVSLGGRNGVAVGRGPALERPVVTADTDAHLSLLDPDSLATLSRITLAATANAIEFVPGSSELVVAVGDAGAQFINVGTGQVVASSASLGARVGLGDRLEVAQAADGVVQVRVGGEMIAAEITLEAPDTLLRDGFER